MMMTDSPSDVLQHGFPSTFSLLAHGVSLSHFAPSMSSKCIALTLSLSRPELPYSVLYCALQRHCTDYDEAWGYYLSATYYY